MIAEREAASLDRNIADIGKFIARYGLAIILLWLGAMKIFTNETDALQPQTQLQPNQSAAQTAQATPTGAEATAADARNMMYSVLYATSGLQNQSQIQGFLEIIAGGLLLFRQVWMYVGLAGSILAMATIYSQLTLLATSQSAWLSAFPYATISGQFLLKDIALFGVALWSLGDSLTDLRRYQALSRVAPTVPGQLVAAPVVSHS